MDRKLLESVIGKTRSKHEFEYQEVCTELEPFYGKLIWTVPHKAGVTEYKMREAHKIAKERGITTIPYLLGVIKRIPWVFHNYTCIIVYNSVY